MIEPNTRQEKIDKGLKYVNSAVRDYITSLQNQIERLHDTIKELQEGIAGQPEDGIIVEPYSELTRKCQPLRLPKTVGIQWQFEKNTNWSQHIEVRLDPKTNELNINASGRIYIQSQAANAIKIILEPQLEKNLIKNLPLKTILESQQKDGVAKPPPAK